MAPWVPFVYAGKALASPSVFLSKHCAKISGFIVIEAIIEIHVLWPLLLLRNNSPNWLSSRTLLARDLF